MNVSFWPQPGISMHPDVIKSPSSL